MVGDMEDRKYYGLTPYDVPVVHKSKYRFGAFNDILLNDIH